MDCSWSTTQMVSEPLQKEMSLRGTMSLEMNWNTSPWPWSLPALTRHLCTSVPVVTPQRCKAISSLHKIEAKQGGREHCPQDFWPQYSTQDCTKVLLWPNLPYLSFPILVPSKMFPIGIKVSAPAWYFSKLESLNPNWIFSKANFSSQLQMWKNFDWIEYLSNKEKITLILKRSSEILQWSLSMTDAYCTGKRVLWWDFLRWGGQSKNKRMQKAEGSERFADSMWAQDYSEGGKQLVGLKQHQLITSQSCMCKV